MFRKYTHIFLILFMVSALNACAFGTQMSLQDTNVHIVGGKKIGAIVLVSDRRPYVLSENKSPQWIGLQRSGGGIPYGVHTSSGKPLARELGAELARIINNSGGHAREVPVSLKVDGRKQAIKELRSGQYLKAMLLKIYQWKIDTYINPRFQYNLELSVLNAKGKVLARESSKGDRNLDGSFWNPVGASERSVRVELEKILDNLLNSNKIRKAL